MISPTQQEISFGRKIGKAIRNKTGGWKTCTPEGKLCEQEHPSLIRAVACFYAGRMNFLDMAHGFPYNGITLAHMICENPKGTLEFIRDSWMYDHNRFKDRSRRRSDQIVEVIQALSVLEKSLMHPTPSTSDVIGSLREAQGQLQSLLDIPEKEWLLKE